MPQRVTERDVGATQVTPAAFVPPPSRRRRRGRGGAGWGNCLVRMAVLALFAAAAVLILLLSLAVVQYFALAATLPSVEDLQSHAAQFETTRILDRDGHLLYEILDPQAGRRTHTRLQEISPYLLAAVIATEDSQFYSHPGFDLLAIGRAIWQNVGTGGGGPGASTITQQIARNLLFTPEEAAQRSALRKIREILLAAEITRRYSKDEILELYLNQVYFGNLAYGIEAAAETYFGMTADRLTLGQASFLAGLIQAPSVYDVYTNRETTLGRQRTILGLMAITSDEQGCIFVSNAPEPICVSPEVGRRRRGGDHQLRLPRTGHQPPLSALGPIHSRTARATLRPPDDLSLRLHRPHHARSGNPGPGPGGGPDARRRAGGPPRLERGADRHPAVDGRDPGHGRIG